MRRIKRYRKTKESLMDMMEAGRQNPMLEITFRDRRGTHIQKLYAGYQDRLSVYREGEYTFVVTQNSKLGYAGLEAFRGEEQTGEIYVDEKDMRERFGKDDPSPYTIIRRLRDSMGPY